MVSIDISWESFQKFQIILNFQEALKPFTPNPEHSRRKGLQMEWKPQARSPVFENFGNPVPHMVVLFSGNSRNVVPIVIGNINYGNSNWKFSLSGKHPVSCIILTPLVGDGSLSTCAVSKWI